jgi:hypothetical protein
MENKVTSDTILNWIKEKVEQKKADFDVEFWMKVAMSLTILLPEEIGKLYDFQKEVAQMRLDILGGQEKRNVSEVKMRVEASDVYRDMKKQEAKISQIEELVRISKIQARINSGN